MASSLYDKGREKFAKAQINWETDTIKAVLVDTGAYSFSQTHEFLSDVAGAAEGTANRLREAQWDVTETGNPTPEGVTGTTVYFGGAEGEREAAEEVGKVLQAPVEPRLPELAEQPPGVIVVVTG